jgi:hypothetical protein
MFVSTSPFIGLYYDLSLLILLLFHIRPSLLISDYQSISARGLYQSICLSVYLGPTVCACLDSTLFAYLLPYEFCKSALMCLFNKNSVWLYRCLCSYLSIRLYQYVRLSIFLSVALLRNIWFVFPQLALVPRSSVQKNCNNFHGKNLIISAKVNLNLASVLSSCNLWNKFIALFIVYLQIHATTWQSICAVHMYMLV